MSKNETADANRQRYDALRLAYWAIVDAITAAGHIASRAADCFECSDDYEAFSQMRRAIGDLMMTPEMRAVKDAMFKARARL